MRARFLLMMAILMLMWFGVTSFDPRAETYTGMHVQMVRGRPYLVLQELNTFGIYTPTGKKIEGWKQVFDPRGGIVLGTFEIPPGTAGAVVPEKPASPDKSPAEKPPDKTARQEASPPDKTEKKPPEKVPEGLGLFFDTRCVVFNLSAPNPNKEESPVSPAYPFNWIPEASAELNGLVFAFGKERKERPKDIEEAEKELLKEGVLKVARFEGQNWAELPDLKGPLIRPGRAGFLMQAVSLNGRIALLWRGAKTDQVLGEHVEGPRLITEGGIGMALFDGTKFSPETRTITDLPKGNSCLWAEKGMIKCLVQTRSSERDTTGKRGRMEIWTIDPDSGKAQRDETIAPERDTIGLFPFQAAERFTWENQEYILRSTWQNFELWRRGEKGEWELVNNGAAGLPALNLERRLYSALGLCAGLILLGAWMAYLRRRAALILIRKLQPRDLYAPLGTRAMAFFADFFLVSILSVLTRRFYSEPFIDIFPFNFYVGQPALSFVVCYGVYFVASEWLFGATPGKFLMGLRVVADGGRKAPFWAVLVRNAIGLYERQPWMLLVAAPMVVFSPRRQRVGDLLSRTFVVQKQGLDLFMAQQAEAGLGEAMQKLPDDPVLTIEKKKKEN
jgi:uncharacterized RDD family membrane protein YckC